MYIHIYNYIGLHIDLCTHVKLAAIQMYIIMHSAYMYII